jgi:uncharacterized protein YcfL
MKKTILLLVLACIFAGCNGLQATNEMKKVIAENAATAANPETPTVETAKLGLAKNANIFVTYFDAATVNVFAYWFDENKKIYCTPKYYNLFNKMCIAGKMFDVNAQLGNYTDPETINLYIEEKKWIRQVHDGIQGKEVAR